MTGIAAVCVRDALIAFMAATAQAQAEATKEAQRAGIAHARANGEANVYKGRKPSFNRKQFESAQTMLGKIRKRWRSREKYRAHAADSLPHQG